MINILVALVGIAIAAYTDFKTGYVPDKLSHVLIGIGILWVIFSYPFNDMILIFGMAAAVFGIGFIAYIFGQFGGGDVKLFTALVLLIPFYPQEIIPYIQNIGITPFFTEYPFILSIFLFAAIMDLFVVSIDYYIKLHGIKKKIKDFRKKFWIGIVYISILIPVFVFWYFLSPALLIVFIPMMTAFLIIPFRQDILKHFAATKKKISKLDEDDVIALEMLDKKTKKKLGLWRKTFTPPELRKIKARARKAKIRNITVYENLPKFVPFIFLSLIINLLLGDVLFYLLASSML